MSAKDFFRKRQGLLVIIGWLIIVATYISKDVLRENLKDVADSINAAESLYLLRDDTLTLHQEVDAVDAHLVEAETNILRTQRRAPKGELKAYESSIGFHRNADSVLRIEDEMFLEVDNLSRLVAIAPPNSEYMKQFTDLYWKWDALKMKTLEEESAELHIPIEQFHPTASEKRSIKTYGDVWLLGQRLHLIGAVILDQAHETKERKEHLVNVFTPISYVLWGFGAVLTLVSKLFEGDEAIEDEA